MNHKHPYCCDEFADLTNEHEVRAYESASFASRDRDAVIEQQDNGTWNVIDVNERYAYDEPVYAFKGIRFCPFCGERADRPGMEIIYYDDGNPLRHADGSYVRWRDVAADGIYEVDELEWIKKETAKVVKKADSEYRKAQFVCNDLVAKYGLDWHKLPNKEEIKAAQEKEYEENKNRVLSNLAKHDEKATSSCTR